MAGSMMSPAPAGAVGPAVTRQDTRLTGQVGELAGDGGRVNQNDGLLSWPEMGEGGVEVVGDDSVVEPVDHAAPEVDGDDGCGPGAGEGADSVAMAASVPGTRSASTWTCTLR